MRQMLTQKPRGLPRGSPLPISLLFFYFYRADTIFVFIINRLFLDIFFIEVVSHVYKPSREA